VDGTEHMSSMRGCKCRCHGERLRCEVDAMQKGSGAWGKVQYVRETDD
jgi:hypothetical protein